MHWLWMLISSPSRTGVSRTRPFPATSSSISLASLFLSATLAFGARTGRTSNKTQARARASSRASAASVLLPIWITLPSSMDAPPEPTEHDRAVGRNRQEGESAGEEDQDKLCAIAREKSAEHPARRPRRGDQQTAASLTMLPHSLPAFPPRDGTERRVDQNIETARPRAAPEQELRAVRRAAQPERRDGQSRREGHEDGEDEQGLQQRPD